MNNSKSTIVIMYPANTGGVAEVCLSLQEGFKNLGYKVTLIHGLTAAFIFSVKNIFSAQKHILISNLHYGIFGLLFKESIFIIHGFPQRKHEGFLRYYIVVYGHKLFALFNKKSVAVSYFTKFVSENFYNIQVHQVIHNILPFDFFNTALNYNAGKEINTVTFVGRVIKEKGIDKILKAAELIRSTGQKIVVNIVGSGTFIPELKEAYPNSDNIYHGYLSSEDKYAVLAKSCSFISLHPAEPYGITALEASSLGVHCCLSALGGHTEFVPHEIFFPINNVEDIPEIAAVILKSFLYKANPVFTDTLHLSKEKYYSNYAQEFINTL